MELQVAFDSAKKEKLNPAEVFSLLHAIGIVCTANEQQAVVEAFNENGAFTREEFVDIAESLDYSVDSKTKFEASLLSIAGANGRVPVDHLLRMVIVAGARVGLTQIEAEEVMRFQLGPRSFDKPEVSIDEAMSILN